MTQPSATGPLSRAISISLSAHFALFAIFFLKMTFFPSQPIEIKRAMRVDLVGLPDKVVTLPPEDVKPVEAPKPVDTPAPVAPPKPKATPKKPTAPKVPTKKADTKKIEKSQDTAMERLKQMQALEKLKRQQKEAAAKAAAQASAVRGNQVSKGNSLTGLEQIEYDRYFDQIEKVVYSNWALPEWLASAELRAQAQVLIDQTGHVVNKKITRSSGNETFDAEVLSAIDKSSPFPQPPARLQGVLANQGIVFNFPD